MKELHIKEQNEEFEKMCRRCDFWSQDGCVAKKGDSCIVDEARGERVGK